ncbi:MAG: guanylate kinase [Candidatus Omnitrophica bacterium]|nr:guanylate kinase [Candidatus Omnitrophota bacterium]
MSGERLVLVVSSPSGGGKTTIVSRVLCEIGRIARSVSYTTRPPRKGEVDKEDYYFISGEAFRKRIDSGDLLEWEELFGHYYGTSKEQVEKVLMGGDDIILSIDVNGARSVREKVPDCVSVFIMPPSRETLAKRLLSRNTEEREDLAKRLAESEKEISSSEEYDYLIVNDDLDKAVVELKTIIETERKNRRGKKKGYL